MRLDCAFDGSSPYCSLVCDDNSTCCAVGCGFDGFFYYRPSSPSGDDRQRSRVNKCAWYGSIQPIDSIHATQVNGRRSQIPSSLLQSLYCKRIVMVIAL